eukprot:5143953-Amphidinium_carterae.2
MIRTQIEECAAKASSPTPTEERVETAGVNLKYCVRVLQHTGIGLDEPCFWGQVYLQQCNSCCCALGVCLGRDGRGVDCHSIMTKLRVFYEIQSLCLVFFWLASLVEEESCAESELEAHNS